MTSSTVRANRRIWSPSETDLGGRPGYPVDIHSFRPVETAARILGGELTPELVEQVEMGAEFMPRARRGEHPCIFCRKRFAGAVARIAWLETPGGTKRALFGVCEECDGPDVAEQLNKRLGAVRTTVN
jgi:hypothetical protein